MAYGGNLDYVDRMNSSVERYNQIMDERRRAANRYQDQGQEIALGDAAAARGIQDRQFAEDQRRFNLMQPEAGRQFDSRMNVLRDLFAGNQGGYAPMPGGPQGGQGYSMGMDGSRGARRGPPDNRMQVQIDQYLAQLLGSR